MINKTIAVLGSHSALDVCRGAKDEGFSTLVVTQKGRNKTYDTYYKTQGGVGCVDECLQLDKFSDLLKPEVIKKLNQKNSIFIPHRSLEAYLNFDYDAIEKKFTVPIFGNRFLLKIEERGTKFGQYDLLKEAEIRYPLQFKNPKDIDRLVLVKVLEKDRIFERAFFIADSYASYRHEVERRIKAKMFSEDQIKNAIIEEFIVGVHVNFNFFYSPLKRRLELLGTDTRRQTNLDGLLRLTGNLQGKIMADYKLETKYEEAGHIAVTVLESMLEKVFEMGERFVKASQRLVPPGVIGPFALQSIIIPGPPKKDIIVVDVSPRVPGSPGISATPYSSYLFGKSITVGRRIAMEIKMGIRENCLQKVLT